MTRRVWVLLACLAYATGTSGVAAQTAAALEACFSAAEFANDKCGQSDSDAAGRLHCLQRARTIHEDCLDRVHAAMKSTAPAASASKSAAGEQDQVASKPDSASGFADQGLSGTPSGEPEQVFSGCPVVRAPAVAMTGTLQGDKMPNEESPSTQGRQASPAGRLRLEISPAHSASTENPGSEPARSSTSAATVAPVGALARPQTVERPQSTAIAATAATPATPQLEMAARASDWIVSETVSPVDFKPSVTARLPSKSSDNVNAASAILLRCRAGRIEVSLSTAGSWRPLRAANVEVVRTTATGTAHPSRWPLAADGKTASQIENVADGVESWDMLTTVRVIDGGGDTGAAQFDLTGIEAVLGRLATVCLPRPMEARAQHR